jgi:hypothetical protein
MSYWYQSPYNNRHPKTKIQCEAVSAKGKFTLAGGTVVQPVRLRYLPHGHWVLDLIMSEKEHLAAYIEDMGIVVVPVSAIDFSK